MSDILQVLIDWDKRLADMDKGEFEGGIMTTICLEQRDTICKAIAEIERLQGVLKDIGDFAYDLSSGDFW